MDENIYLLARELNKQLINEPSFIRLKELDKSIENNDEVISLAYKKDMASMKYNDLLKIYDENNELVIEAKKELSNAKYNLDMHPLVKEYNSTYLEVKKILFEINKIIFSDYKRGGSPCR